MSADLTTGHVANTFYWVNDSSPSGSEMYLASSSSSRIWTENGVDIPKGDYFILNDGGSNSRVLRFENISSTSTSNRVTVFDPSMGFSTDWEHNETAGFIVYDGVQHEFHVTPTSSSDGTIRFDSGLSNVLYTVKGNSITLDSSVGTAGSVGSNTIWVTYDSKSAYGVIALPIPINAAVDPDGSDVTMGTTVDSFRSLVPESSRVVNFAAQSNSGSSVTYLNIDILQG